MKPNRGTELEVIRGLRAAVEEAGGTVLAPKSDRSASHPDLVVRSGQRVFVVEVKSAPDNRVEELTGRFASAWLSAKRQAALRAAEPLPVVLVPSITDRGLNTVAEFMHRELPGVAWGMIDSHGRRVFRELTGLALDAEPATKARQAPAETVEAGEPFSDLGQWLAKVLLASRLPPRLIAAPRERFDRAVQLARAARVSPPTVTRWLKALRARGFLDERRGGLQLVRIQDYLELWRSAVRAPGREFSVRFLLPKGEARAQLHEAIAAHVRDRLRDGGPTKYEGEVCWASGPRVCLAGFEAASALGHGHVIGAPIHLFCEHVTDVTLRDLGLEIVPPDRATLRVVEPAWPECVFRATVIAPAGERPSLPTCDIVQTWLDVSRHPARGREQSEEIERHVFARWLYPDQRDAHGT